MKESIQELWNTEYLKSADSVFEAFFFRMLGGKQQSKSKMTIGPNNPYFGRS
jgi:hypothetical protein